MICIRCVEATEMTQERGPTFRFFCRTCGLNSERGYLTDRWLLPIRRPNRGHIYVIDWLLARDRTIIWSSPGDTWDKEKATLVADLPLMPMTSNLDDIEKEMMLQ